MTLDNGGTMKIMEQTYCARCYAVHTDNHKCPNCDLQRRTYEKYCKRCMYVHVNVFTKCKPWTPKEQ